MSFKYLTTKKFNWTVSFEKQTLKWLMGMLTNENFGGQKQLLTPPHSFKTRRTKTATNIGFAARLAGHWSNGHFIAVVLHLGWTNIAGLLFVNLYFYIFNQQRFRAGRAMNSSPAASPARYFFLLKNFFFFF